MSFSDSVQVCAHPGSPRHVNRCLNMKPTQPSPLTLDENKTTESEEPIPAEVSICEKLFSVGKLKKKFSDLCSAM